MYPHRNTDIVSTQYSCMTCQLVLDSSSSQRQHYQTDWHRYNLKRKVAGLGAVTEPDFMQRVTTHHEQLTKTEASQKDSAKVVCSFCLKIFPTQKGLDNHLRSGKHEEAVDTREVIRSSARALASLGDAQNDAVLVDLHGASVEEESLSLEDLEARLEAVDPLACLFCSRVSPSVQKNVGHMISRHSFYVPDVEFLSDLDGMMRYLSQKIHYGNTCLYCHRHFHSATATKNHMMSKGHTMIGFEGEGEAEVAPFYDFCQETFAAPDDGDDADMHDSDFEDVDEDAAMDIEDDANMSRPAVITADDSELILPSGKRVGHRDYRRYYKQHLRPFHEADMPSYLIAQNEDMEQSSGSHSSLALRARERQAQALTANSEGLFASSGIKSKAESKDQRHWLKAVSKRMLHLGVAANRFQKHYREQIL